MSFLGGVGIILAALLALWLAAGFGFFCFGMARRPVKDNFAEGQEKTKNNGQLNAHIDEIHEGIAWIEAQPYQELTVQSYDGLKLAGRYFPHEGSDKTALLFHGYRGIPHNDFSCSMQLFYELGYNILLVDERAHGKSEGRYLGFGVLERFDVLAWSQEINARFAPRQQILVGLSMGSATVQMALGLALPQNVQGVIADCGFTSPWDIVCAVSKSWFNLPWWVLVPGIDMWCRLLAGYSLKEYSTLTALAQTKVPVLFIHGQSDNFVPYWMSEAGYEACASRKRLLGVPGATHAASFLVDKPGCTQAVTEFVNSLQ